METIILFGFGKYFMHKRELVKRYKIKFILDNGVALGEVKKWEGIDVINPRNADLTGKEKIFLLSVKFFSMWKQLIDFGINPDRIVHPFYEEPYFQSDEIISLYVKKIKFEKSNLKIVESDNIEKCIHNEYEWNEYIRSVYERRFPIIKAVANMDTRPVSFQFAAERGTPIDRFYIDKFLKDNSKYIKGDVLEIEDDTYTRKFGVKVNKSLVTDVSSSADIVDFNSNLETGEGIKSNIADCFIITQTLMYIYNLKEARKNIWKTLKKDGVALITVSGLSQNSRRCMDGYGAFFNFNAMALRKLFDGDDTEVLDVGSYGNAKTVTAHLVGLCQEDLKCEDFLPNDPYYPLVVYAVVKKK